MIKQAFERGFMMAALNNGVPITQATVLAKNAGDEWQQAMNNNIPDQPTRNAIDAHLFESITGGKSPQSATNMMYNPQAGSSLVRGVSSLMQDYPNYTNALERVNSAVPDPAGAPQELQNRFVTDEAFRRLTNNVPDFMHSLNALAPETYPSGAAGEQLFKDKIQSNYGRAGEGRSARLHMQGVEIPNKVTQPYPIATQLGNFTPHKTPQVTAQPPQTNLGLPHMSGQLMQSLKPR